MKIAVAQRNFHQGNIPHNTAIILSSIKEARKKKAELFIVAGYALTGYPLYDLTTYDSFVYQIHNSLQQIADACQDIAFLTATPYYSDEKQLHYGVAHCFQGNIEYLGETLYPNLQLGLKHLTVKAHAISMIIGDTSASFAAIEQLTTLGNTDLLIYLSATPFDYSLPKRRIDQLMSLTKQLNTPLLFVNHIGASTDLLFEGSSMAFSAEGSLVVSAGLFQEQMFYVDSSQLHSNSYESLLIDIPDKSTLIRDALVLGIQDFFYKSGFRQAVLGLSGGLDSAVTAVLAVEALGAENVLGVMMPSQFSTEHSLIDAKQLALNLQIQTELIPIESQYHAVMNSLQYIFKNKEFGITEENIQARLRGLLLMAISNKSGHIVLNSSNKSEAAVGYGTLYGDMSGSLSVLGDVYKTEVYQLAELINREKGVIPLNIIQKPPSAELSPGQKDSDSLPAYELLDALLFQFIEEGKGSDELIKDGFDPKLVKRIISLVNRSEFKRFQAPPVLKVSPRTLKTDRSMPQNSSFVI
ncbi:MAG: NAD+ synthase [Bacteroidales bacterium]|nr:NAD+ synthase [Bacteroidales bacterium]MDD3702366.1 NAD+ synthase [Bacteroidales bacterium]MDY0369139.1 NAD+ synthase [Bacteroidales bacterium]